MDLPALTGSFEEGACSASLFINNPGGSSSWRAQLFVTAATLIYNGNDFDSLLTTPYSAAP